MRERLGRPESRTVVVWAALTALICGLFSAALATWGAWHTARPLPDAAETTSLVAELLPGYEVNEIDPGAALFTFYSQPLRPRNLKSLLLLDGGEYQQGSSVATVRTAPRAAQQEMVALAERRLRETGWRTFPPHVTPELTCRAGGGCTPAGGPDNVSVVARRDDTGVDIHWLANPSIDGTHLTVAVYRDTPPAVLPAGIGGGLVGALLGGLVFAWASRRTRRPHPAANGVTVLYAVTMLFWWAPVLLAAPQLLGHHRDEPHPVWHPLWEWLGQPALSLFFVVGAGCALFALALAMVPRRDTDPLATPAPEFAR
ncbi:hypothetical protein [Micromonospora musae]|uniref:Uncharacterized protein n=1 Tax=Micromonospora musae TaxID=1894970 RepID=A0A3A9Y3X6_9ACTN|nr:hypothetical protein [Micromonospora musae]RKN28514.1 hypothetical protein D7044_25085 [Micromonospora musae]